MNTYYELQTELLEGAFEANLITIDDLHEAEDNIEGIFIEFCVTNQGLAVMSAKVVPYSQIEDIDETCEMYIGYEDISIFSYTPKRKVA